METILTTLAGFFLGYVFGAFPTGYFAGRLWNVDVRKHGSGRTGGTNVLRSAGWGAFVITIIGDVLKGMIPVWLARALFPGNELAPAIAVTGAVLGHNWSIWIALIARPDPTMRYSAPPLGWIQHLAHQGRGGAGVATLSAAMLALFPPLVLILLAPIIAILVIIRYASVASLSAAISAPLLLAFFVWRGDAPPVYLAVMILNSIIIILVHIPNIKKLRAGTERKFGQRLAERHRK